MGLGRNRMVMIGRSLADLGHMPVMALGDRRPVRSLGNRIERSARKAEGGRHDQ